MTAETRFLFETTFDDPKAFAAEEAKVAEAQTEVEEDPTFSEEELNATREEARAAGREEGIRESNEATERQIATALTVIGDRLNGIFDSQDKSSAAIAENAANIAITIARKIFPDLNRRYSLGEIGRLVAISLARVMDEPRLTIHVNDTLRNDLTAHVEELRQTKGFEGKIVLLGEPNIPLGDCRMAWSEGGAERNTAAMWQQIDEIVENNIGTLVDAIEGVEKADDTEAPEPEMTSEPASTEVFEAGSLEDESAKTIKQDEEPVEHGDIGETDAPPESESGLGASETPSDEAEPTAVEGAEDAENKDVGHVDNEEAKDPPATEAETPPDGSSSDSDTS